MARKDLDHDRQGFYKTRIAPTPSGYLHLGNAFSFALTASLALKTGAKLLLRIDDMDSMRVRPEYVKDIFSTLDFMVIDWDEGPDDPEELKLFFSQTGRLPLYEKALEKLRSDGHLFACDCSRSELDSASGYPGTCEEKKIPLDTPGVCWRLKTNRYDSVSYIDYEIGIVSSPFPVSMTDFIVRKKDGRPSYQLTSVIDDVFFNIDLIVRGEDLIPSTIAQLVLAQKLNLNTFLNAHFLFHALLLTPENRKLSKSDNVLSIAAMRKDDLDPIDLYNLLSQSISVRPAMRSWHPLADYVLTRM